MVKPVFRLIPGRPVAGRHPILYRDPRISFGPTELAALSDEAKRELAPVRIHEHTAVRIEDDPAQTVDVASQRRSIGPLTIDSNVKQPVPDGRCQAGAAYDRLTIPDLASQRSASGLTGVFVKSCPGDVVEHSVKLFVRDWTIGFDHSMYQVVDIAPSII
jgi:hypothetical protein